MDHRERILKALNLEEPDVVPVFHSGSEELLGELPSVLGMIDDLAKNEPDNWRDIMSKAFENGFIETQPTLMDASIKIGFDAAATLPPGFVMSDFIDERKATDMYGRLYESKEINGKFVPVYKEGLLTTPEKWEEWPKPDTGEFVERYSGIYKKLKDEFSDKIFIIAWLGSLFEHWQVMGFTPFVHQLYKNPSFIRKALDYYTNLEIEFMKSCIDEGAEVVIHSDDLAYKSGPLISPTMLEEFYGPCYKKIVNTAHKREAKIILHSCGNVIPILDNIVGWGFDGLHSLEPTAGVDLGVAKEKVGDKICLIGNIDITHILVDAKPEEVEEAVKEAIRKAAKGGGYILAPTNDHPAMSRENLRIMTEATHKYGKYPISI